MHEQYDNIVIGSGAGGSAAAYQLTESGQSVLLLERGGQLPLDGSTLDVEQVLGRQRFSSNETWLDTHDKPFVPGEFFNLGGKTKWYGAALLRFSKQEFDADPVHQCLPWPVTYEEFEPYYSKAEEMMAVTDFAIEPQLAKISRCIMAADSDWNSRPLPLALSRDILHSPQEARHFDGFASPSGLKHDAQNVFLLPLQNKRHFTCHSGKQVSRLLSDSNAYQLTGVECTDGSRYYARRIFLAAGALHSPRLLERYMQAHALDCEFAGSFYKCHLNSVMLAFSPARKTDTLRKTLLMLNARYPHSSVQTLGWLDGNILVTQLPTWIPSFITQYLGARIYGFWLTSEDGSNKDNRIHFSGQHTEYDKLDYRHARIPEAMTEHQQLIRAFRHRLLRCGMLSFTRTMPLAASAHACGTLVSGTSPDSSVVDPSGKVWGFDNLYVCDGSALPRSGKVNPALTIYAWALRTAELALKQNGSE